MNRANISVISAIIASITIAGRKWSSKAVRKAGVNMISIDAELIFPSKPKEMSKEV